MNRVLLAAAVMLGALAIASPAAHADDLECTGAVEGGTVDNVVVPARSVCYLNVTNVLGNVDVKEGSVFISACSTVAGNVTADGAADVVISCSTISGRVQVVRGGEGLIDKSTVGGAVLFAMNDARVEITDSVFESSFRYNGTPGA